MMEIHAILDKDAYIKANEEFLLPVCATPLKEFPFLTQLTGGGLRPREFSILCGATGSGKTTFAANVSKSLMYSDVNHFVASVETGYTDFVKRVMSAMAKKDWNTGDPVPVDDLKQFNESHGHYFVRKNLFLSLYEDRFTVNQLIHDIKWMVDNKGIKVAIVDNLNFFLEVTSASNQLIEMDRVIHDLIIFCKQTDVHIIMIMHPKKTENGRVESEFDIKGSSTAVQEAHNVFLWNRPSKDLIDSGAGHITDRELKVAKMRRRGIAIGKRLLFSTEDGVSYQEKGYY
jgi:replicative DNA helicase